MEELKILTSDNYYLSITLFQYKSAFTKKSIVIINSATGISQKYYYKFANFLSENGYSVITYDYRGIGKSKPILLKGFNCDFVTWGKLDFHAIIDYCLIHFKDYKLFVIGHSIGGTIVGMTSLCNKINGIILIGAQTSYYKDWSKYKSRLFMLWHCVMPLISKIFGYFPGRLFGRMEDIPLGVIKQWDKRKKHPDMGYQLKNEGVELFYHEYKNKLITLYIEDDYIGTEKAIKRMNKFFTNAKQEIESISPAHYNERNIGHFGLFKSKFKNKLWPLVLNRIIDLDKLTL